MTSQSDQAMSQMQTEPLAGLTPPLYEAFRPFNPSDGEMRIFAPVAYALVRQAQIVPIVHIEALNLAHWFPVCWQITDGSPTLVVLRTLHSDGSRQPQGSPASMVSLPLALRAYPFVVGGGDTDAEKDTHLIETAIPDKPTDIGSPIMLPSGKATPGTKMKLQAVAAFNNALPDTIAITEALRRNDLLEPWPLKFEVAGGHIAVPDLHVVKPSEFNSPRIFKIVEAHGPAAATFLGAHRISLFRAGVLFQAAKGAEPAANER
jgi:hypothetical protein